MDSEREAQAIVNFEAESRKIATTLWMVGGLWVAFLRRGGTGTGWGEPISECCQQGVQLCSLHATVYESGWGAKQGSGPSMEARPISDIRHRAARQVSGTPGRGMREWVFADRQLHALCECLPWHFSVLNQGEKLGRMPME